MIQDSTLLSPLTGWTLLFLLSGIWIALGIAWGRKAKNLDGFMLAGRNVGLAFGTATVVATWVTSNTTMLAPQFALELGVWGLLAYSTASFGLFLFAPLAKRIKRLMPNGFTSGDFIRLRYGRPTWILFLCISIFYGFTWLVSMGMAGGLLMNALAGIPYPVGMSVILAVCVTYTLFGGMYAVIGTDFIQSVIILIGIVVVGYAVLDQLTFSEVYARLEHDRPMLLNAMLPAAIMAVCNNLLFGLGEVFHSNVWWSRAFAMREDTGEKAYLIGGLLWFPVPIAAGFIALASDSLGINVVSPDMVGPMVAAKVLGPIGAIVVFAVFFCSLASSIDSLLAATSDLLLEDVYRRLIKPTASDQQLQKASRAVIVGLGVLTWAFCVPRIGTLATVLFFAGPLVASTIWPIAAGLYWERATASGAFFGMLCGSLCGLIAYWALGWYTASLIGAGVSMLVVAATSWRSNEQFNWKNLKE